MTLRLFLKLAERHRERTRREDRRAGEIIAILYNINRDSQKDPKGLDWQDVFPEWKEEEPQSEDEMFEAMQLWVGAPGGLSH